MKNIYLITLLSVFQSTPSYADFFTDVAKGVATNVLSAAIYSTIVSPAQTPVLTKIPPTIDGSVNDKERVKGIINAIMDSATPLEERIGFYAMKVDYFSAGVVDHKFILKDRKYFEKKWPERDYRIISIDEITVDPNKKFAAARYTAEYLVRRPGDEKSGTTKIVILLGSFDIQPRIYAIKEWVYRN